MDISFLNSSMYYPLRADMHLSMANNGFHTASQLHDLWVVLSFVFISFYFFFIFVFFRQPFDIRALMEGNPSPSYITQSTMQSKCIHARLNLRLELIFHSVIQKPPGVPFLHQFYLNICDDVGWQ